MAYWIHLNDGAAMIACTTTADRRFDTPTMGPGIFWSNMPTRSLGRFLVKMDRKGGPVSFAFILGVTEPNLQDREKTVAYIKAWPMYDVLCWAQRGEPGSIVGAVQKALEERGLSGLTDSEVPQIRVLETPAEVTTAHSLKVRVGRTLARVIMAG